MQRVLFALFVVGCAGSASGPSSGGGGKADGDSSTDGGVDAARVTLAGTCNINTTEYRDGYGYRDTTTQPIALAIHVESVDADGNASGTVHVGSPWEQIPDDMWRAWCHRAHQDGQPLTNSCAIGPFDIKTAALAFGQGAYTSFKSSATGYALSISAFEELGRDTYYDTDWTNVSFFCSLQ